LPGLITYINQIVIFLVGHEWLMLVKRLACMEGILRLKATVYIDVMDLVGVTNSKH
jgi:hypothetical protein